MLVPFRYSLLCHNQQAETVDLIIFCINSGAWLHLWENCASAGSFEKSNV